MSDVIKFKHFEPIQPRDPDKEVLSNATMNSAIQQALERQRERLINVTNYLEALSRQILAGSYTPSVVEQSPSDSIDAV